MLPGLPDPESRSVAASWRRQGRFPTLSRGVQTLGFYPTFPPSAEGASCHSEPRMNTNWCLFVSICGFVFSWHWRFDLPPPTFSLYSVALRERYFVVDLGQCQGAIQALQGNPVFEPGIVRQGPVTILTTLVKLHPDLVLGDQ